MLQPRDVAGDLHHVVERNSGGLLQLKEQVREQNAMVCGVPCHQQFS